MTKLKYSGQAMLKSRDASGIAVIAQMVAFYCERNILLRHEIENLRVRIKMPHFQRKAVVDSLKLCEAASPFPDNENTLQLSLQFEYRFGEADIIIEDIIITFTDTPVETYEFSIKSNDNKS